MAAVASTKANMSVADTQSAAVTQRGGAISGGRRRWRRYKVAPANTGSITDCAIPPATTILTGEANSR